MSEECLLRLGIRSDDEIFTISSFGNTSKIVSYGYSCQFLNDCDSGQCSSHGLRRQDGLNESCLRDLLHDSEYVLTYEDRDGDWMLVGDVPWG